MGKKFDFDNNPVSEAFKAGNKARKKESVQDTVESVNDIQAQIDLFNEQLGDYRHKAEIRNGRPWIEYLNSYKPFSFPAGLVVEEDLIIRDCHEEFSLPIGLTVNKCLALDNCTKLISLPSGLTVRDLKLEYCPNITSIPDDICIGGKLHIDRCPGLIIIPPGISYSNSGRGFTLDKNLAKSLPMKLVSMNSQSIDEAFKAGNKARKKESVQDAVESVDNVQTQVDLFKEQTGIELEIKDGHPYFDGDLWLNRCTGLTSLPAGLEVKGRLDLESCTRLACLPKGLKVGGCLFLEGCTGLTGLPDGLEVGGHLYLRDCTGLTRLPDNLEVEGALCLDGCTGLTSLPTGLKVGSSLHLEGCTGLTSLPFDLVVQGDWIMHKGILTPFFRKLGIPVDDDGYTDGEHWHKWQKAHGYLTEAFKAGNRARKKESAADTVESVSNTITFKELWDLFNTPEIQHSFETMLEDLIAKHGLNLETGRPDIHRQHGHRHLNLYRNNERICEFYWNNEYKGNNRHLSWLYMVPQDNTIAGCALCVIKNSADIKLYADAVIRLKQVLLGEHGDDFANEAFRAGNAARKKESTQDAVSDITQVPLSVEELEQAFKRTDNLRDKAIDIIHEIADKHDLGISIEAVKQPSSPFNRMTRRNAEREWAVYEFGDMIGTLKWWGSAGMLEWLTIVPTDTTIAGCTLFYVDAHGNLWQIYHDSIERLRRMLMRLPGTDMNEAFRAGNRARKKESAQDAVKSVDSIQTQIDLFKEQTDIELEIRDGCPYFDGNLILYSCTGLTSLPAGLKVRGELYLRDCTGLTSLPAGLKVGGDLNLEGCTGLTSLPFDTVVQGYWILHRGILTPFFKKLGIWVKEGDTHAFEWRKWQEAHGYLTEAFRAGNQARKKESVQDTVQDVEIDRMPDWSGTPLETFEDMHRILMDIDLSTKRISTDDSIYYQEFMEHGKKKPFESFSAAVFDAGCTIDFYLEDDVITMTALPIGSGVMTLFSPSPGYRKTHRPYIESNMGHPQWKVDPELWAELLSWIDKHEVL